MPTQAITDPNYFVEKSYSVGLHLYLYLWQISMPAT